jgi:alpha-D-ribose 1-methylphosphonate 5-triphosphate diphosphatase
MILPGMIDIHGDAFERQIMPRPNVAFDLGLAMRDTDRQLVANGITTAYHGVTSSWETGLRRIENARALAFMISDLRGRTACDMRFHLRHEAFNLDGEEETLGWIADGLVDALAFNDHMRGIVLGKPIKASKLRDMVARSGLTEVEFMALIERTLAREAEVPASLTRLAEAARRKGIPLLSHDDRHAEDHTFFSGLGCMISEFPTTDQVAAMAAKDGKETVFGAPNVVRGGSHTGCPTAADMAQKGICTILASDYYDPALLEALFQIAPDHPKPVGIGGNLVLRVHGGDRVFQIDDRGQRSFKDDIGDMQFVGRADGVRGINQYLDMQAILFEQIAFRVTRCGLRDEEIGRAAGQYGFPTWDAVVQEIARISNNGRTACRIIAACAGRRGVERISAI